jgi:UbiD family decarboxylase
MVRAMQAPFADLRGYIHALRARGEILDIHCEVDPDLEMAEIHRRVIASGGPALLFHRVKGAALPAVSNLFGTSARVALAFGDEPARFVQELASLPEKLLPPTARGLWRERGLLWKLMGTRLISVRRGPVCEIDEAPRLTGFPTTRSWDMDGGRFFTLPLVLTAPPESGPTNLGLYRMQVHADHETGMHWQIGKGGGFHHHAAESLGRDLPVNVHLGGPPALMLAAIAPLPENVPEMLLAALVQGGSLRMARHAATPLPFASEAEAVLIGKVPALVRRPEGPFGDHYGYYSLQHDYPVFRVERVLRRRDAIIPFTVVGKPRQEDFFLGDYLQELLHPLFPLVMPGVRDLWSYGETGYHALSAAVVRERYRHEAMQSAFRILGEGQLSLTKFLLVIDQALDLRDFKQVLVHVLERADFATDLFVFSNLSMDTLDYAGPKVNEGSKGVLLGLGPARRTLLREFQGEPPRGVTVEVFAPGCLVLTGGELSADVLAGHPAFQAWPLLVWVDDARQASRSSMNFLWTAFTRMNPASDLHSASARIHAGHIVREGPLLIDARMKPSYPRELFCDADTAKLVTRRWKEYFPERTPAMGDSDRAHLD